MGAKGSIRVTFLEQDVVSINNAIADTSNDFIIDDFIFLLKI